jgi:hypothetical protein
MVVSRKAWISSSLVCVLALPILVGAYLIWELSGARTRPWHLEACLGSVLAECRTGPGAFWFRNDYKRLEARAEEADLSLFLIDHKFWLQRDYSSTLSSMLSLLLDTQLLKQKIVQHEKEEQEKAKIFISILRQELGSGNGNAKLWSQFNRNSIDQNRARSLLQQAEFLNAQGEYESALTNALRAWSSWQRHSQSSDQEFARFDDPHLRNRWDEQAAELVGWTKETGRRAILVDKLGHRCILLNKGKVEKSYVANLGRNWQRQKAQERDASTPEGEYNVRSLKASGKYGRALLLDYPNNADRQRFTALKRKGAIPARARIGGNIEIHGGGRADSDWTEGCISLNDGDMLELYERAYPGMPVSIVGSSRFTRTMRGEANASD